MLLTLSTASFSADDAAIAWRWDALNLRPRMPRTCLNARLIVEVEKQL
jgi:hypothetical protein